MMRRLMMAAMPVALMLAGPALADPASDARAAIEAEMLDSAAGWNARDVDRFLAIYADGAGTTFTTQKGVARGKDGIRARYLQGYPPFRSGSVEPVPALGFAFEDFRLIDADHALLIARWTLTPAAGDAQTGMTSLLFERQPGGWRIIADHSS